MTLIPLLHIPDAHDVLSGGRADRHGADACRLPSRHGGCGPRRGIDRARRGWKATSRSLMSAAGRVAKNGGQTIAGGCCRTSRRHDITSEQLKKAEAAHRAPSGVPSRNARRATSSCARHSRKAGSRRTSRGRWASRAPASVRSRRRTPSPCWRPGADASQRRASRSADAPHQA